MRKGKEIKGEEGKFFVTVAPPPPPPPFSVRGDPISGKPKEAGVFF